MTKDLYSKCEVCKKEMDYESMQKGYTICKKCLDKFKKESG